MKRNHYLFLLFLCAALAVTFGIHLAILTGLDFPLFDDEITRSYIVNYILAALLFLIIQMSVAKKSTMTGFIFMFGSAFKFLIFFLVFYPEFHADENMETTEFTAFFVPYAVCLIAEVAYLSKQLNNQTYSEETSEEKKQIK